MNIAFDVHKLSVKLDGNSILEDLTFQVPENAFFTVIGPNGAGKSVFLKTLIGLHLPSNGKVEFFGKKPKERSYSDLGYVPQLKTMDRNFPATAMDLVANGKKGQWVFRISDALKKECLSYLDQFGAKHLAERSHFELSGGELQRVFLARAMIRKPKTIILDEPSTGMDVDGEDDLYHRLEVIRKETQTTILMVTHDQTVAAHHSTHVLLLNQKQIAFGPPEEVLNDQNLRITFGHQSHAHSMPTG